MLPSQPLDTITYGYNNTSWKDLLTSYDGQSIIYDVIGNPIQYRDGLDFTWKYGRSLATATTEDGDVISYEYNKDGIRTSKTINGTTYKLHGSDIVKETPGNTEKLCSQKSPHSSLLMYIKCLFYDNICKVNIYVYFIGILTVLEKCL